MLNAVKRWRFQSKSNSKRDEVGISIDPSSFVKSDTFLEYLFKAKNLINCNFS